MSISCEKKYVFDAAKAPDSQGARSVFEGPRPTAPALSSPTNPPRAMRNGAGKQEPPSTPSSVPRETPVSPGLNTGIDGA